MMGFVLLLGLAVGLALLWGAWSLRKRGGQNQKVWLMVVAALVIFANVAIWTVPNKQGRSLATENR